MSLDDEELAERVAAGVSMASLARDMGIDLAAVRRELARLGLRTARQDTLECARAARVSGAQELLRSCSVHGDVVHRKDARGSFRCPRCNVERVAQRRRSVKQILVAEAGGACTLCGYDRCARALAFHHVNPASKAFGLAVGGVARSLAKARLEAAKCVLLCANCHMEVETGLRSITLE